MDPALYDALHRAYDEDLPFWRRLAHEAKGPILEMGCGTGRVLLPLLQDGLDLWGVDYDLQMLRYLRRKASPEQRARLRLVCADLRWMPLARPFALLIAPCNTLATLEPDARRQVLRRAAHLLHPQGRLAFSLPNPHWVARLPQESESEPEALLWHPETGNPVQVSSAWHREGMRWEVLWHFDHLWPDGMVERRTVRLIHHLAPLAQQRAEFAAAGLEVEACYGSFAAHSWEEDALYVIWVLRRRVKRGTIRQKPSGK